MRKSSVYEALEHSLPRHITAKPFTLLIVTNTTCLIFLHVLLLHSYFYLVLYLCYLLMTVVLNFQLYYFQWG